MELVQSRVIFNQESHTYTLDGRELQGITGMLSRQLFPDKYRAVPEAVLQRAAERGSFVHENCELADSLGIVPACTEARNYVALKERHGLVTAANEYLVSDNEHFASCIDVVFEAGDAVCDLGDIKTTYALDKEYVSWQLSVYAVMFERQNPGVKVRRLYAIWLRGSHAELVEVERKPTEAIDKLMRCEIEGRQFREVTDAVASNPDELPARYADAEQMIIGIDEEIKRLQQTYDELKEGLRREMEKAGVKKWKSPNLQLILKDDSTRETFDSKAFREAHPDIYGQFLKYTAVKGGLTLKVTQTD